MINMKYYVFLMVGIFLSIGLGMMIGISLENQTIIENQQTLLIREIEFRFTNLQNQTDQLKTELTGLNDQNNQLHDLSSLLLKEAVHNKLIGTHIGVVTFAEQDTMAELIDFLEFTGASVQSAVTLLAGISNDKEMPAYAMQQSDELASTMIQELLYSMDHGVLTPLIQEAEDYLLLSHTGIYEYPVDSIILIGQGSSTLAYDNMLIEYAKEAGILVIAVETGQIENSGIAAYKSSGISTVDHVESIYGKLALTSVLSGHKGNFGFGENALDQLPSPLFLETVTPPAQADPIVTDHLVIEPENTEPVQKDESP